MDRSSSLFLISSVEDELSLAVSSLFRVFLRNNKDPKMFERAIVRSFDREEREVEMKKQMLGYCTKWSERVLDVRIEDSFSLQSTDCQALLCLASKFDSHGRLYEELF